jgi:hypothetical protein
VRSLDGCSWCQGQAGHALHRPDGLVSKFLKSILIRVIYAVLCVNTRHWISLVLFPPQKFARYCCSVTRRVKVIQHEGGTALCVNASFTNRGKAKEGDPPQRFAVKAEREPAHSVCSLSCVAMSDFRGPVAERRRNAISRRYILTRRSVAPFGPDAGALRLLALLLLAST